VGSQYEGQRHPEVRMHQDKFFGSQKEEKRGVFKARFGGVPLLNRGGGFEAAKRVRRGKGWNAVTQ